MKTIHLIAVNLNIHFCLLFLSLKALNEGDSMDIPIGILCYENTSAAIPANPVIYIVINIFAVLYVIVLALDVSNVCFTEIIPDFKKLQNHFFSYQF